MNKFKLFLLIVLFSNLLVKADVYVHLSGFPEKVFILGVEGYEMVEKCKFKFIKSIQNILEDAGIKFENDKILKLPNKIDDQPILLNSFLNEVMRNFVDIQEDYLYKFSYNNADGLRLISIDPYPYGENERKEKADSGAAKK